MVCDKRSCKKRGPNEETEEKESLEGNGKMNKKKNGGENMTKIIELDVLECPAPSLNCKEFSS